MRTVLEPHHSLPAVPTLAEAAPPRFTIFRGGAFEASGWLLQEELDKPMVLDFASDSEPGGGWKGKQRGTQEEALCRQSSLGVRLEEHYKAVGAANFMPHMSLVYATDVVVFRAAESAGYTLLDTPHNVAVAAGALRSTTRSEICSKVDGLVRLAVAEGHRRLVLGAWGCGAFGNDVTEVAEIMAQGCRKAAGALDHVVFALPRRDEKCDAFMAALPEAALVEAVSVETTDASVRDWDLEAAEVELHAILTDSCEEAAQRSGLTAQQLRCAADAKAAAAKMLNEIALICLEGLAELVAEDVRARLGLALADGSSSPRQRFDAAAKPLVEEHFRALYRELRAAGSSASR